jgi:hypothetical protein
MHVTLRKITFNNSLLVCTKEDDVMVSFTAYVTAKYKLLQRVII